MIFLVKPLTYTTSKKNLEPLRHTKGGWLAVNETKFGNSVLGCYIRLFG